MLKAAFVQGRLDKDEFDLRVGQTLASRTYADLATVTADLPARLADAQPAKRAALSKRGSRPGQVAVIATMLYAAGWIYAFASSGHGDSPAAGVMFFVVTFIYLCVLIVVAGAALEARHDKSAARRLQRGQGPSAGGPASRRLPTGGPGRQHPPAGPGRWHAAEAARRRRPQPPLLVPGYRSGRSFRPGTAPAGG